ncbi:MAG: toprim domain-containing protein, partial [Parvibaculum sp.]
IERFGIGFAPDDRSGLKSYMLGRDFKLPQMIEAGLLIGGEDIREPYDRFRNRVMFPIADARSRVVAFGGRALDPAAKAKYMNSPETPLFHKGHLLYNLAQARKPAYDGGMVVAVEGYMDVVALGQAGIDPVVAPLGTALTEEQIGLLWRLASEPILCFDGDKAGIRAAHRAVERVLPLLKPGHSLRFALLPEGQDPDDLVRSGGKEAMLAILEAAKPLSEMVWDKEVAAGTWDTPERKAQLQARIGAVIREIADPTVQGFYRDAMKAKLEQLLRPQRGSAGAGGGWQNQRAWNGQKSWTGQRTGSFSGKKGRFGQNKDLFLGNATPQLKQSPLARGGDVGAAKRERLLVLTLLNHPWLLDEHGEAFAFADFGDRELDKIRNEIIDIAALHVPLDREGLRGHLDKRGILDIARRLESGMSLKSETFAWPDAPNDEVEDAWLHLLHWHDRAGDLQNELKAAERALAEELTDENLARLSALKDELARLSKL